MTRYCYLAGPITGLKYDEASDWREEIAHQVDWVAGFTPLSPMRGKEHLRSDQPLASLFDGGSAAVQRDLYDIRRSDAVLVNLLTAKRVSIGTMCELGYAHALGKFIIVALRETEILRDNRGKEYRSGGIHDHLFVHELASQVVHTLDEAITILGEL